MTIDNTQRKLQQTDDSALISDAILSGDTELLKAVVRNPNLSDADKLTLVNHGDYFVLVKLSADTSLTETLVLAIIEASKNLYKNQAEEVLYYLASNTTVTSEQLVLILDTFSSTVIRQKVICNANLSESDVTKFYNLYPSSFENEVAAHPNTSPAILADLWKSLIRNDDSVLSASILAKNPNFPVELFRHEFLPTLWEHPVKPKKSDIIAGIAESPMAPLDLIEDIMTFSNGSEKTKFLAACNKKVPISMVIDNAEEGNTACQLAMSYRINEVLTHLLQSEQASLVKETPAAWAPRLLNWEWIELWIWEAALSKAGIRS